MASAAAAATAAAAVAPAPVPDPAAPLTYGAYRAARATVLSAGADSASQALRYELWRAYAFEEHDALLHALHRALLHSTSGSGPLLPLELIGLVWEHAHSAHPPLCAHVLVIDTTAAGVGRAGTGRSRGITFRAHPPPPLSVRERWHEYDALRMAEWLQQQRDAQANAGTAEVASAAAAAAAPVHVHPPPPYSDPALGAGRVWRATAARGPHRVVCWPDTPGAVVDARGPEPSAYEHTRALLWLVDADKNLSPVRPMPVVPHSDALDAVFAATPSAQARVTAAFSSGFNTVVRHRRTVALQGAAVRRDAAAAAAAAAAAPAGESPAGPPVPAVAGASAGAAAAAAASTTATGGSAAPPSTDVNSFAGAPDSAVVRLTADERRAAEHVVVLIVSAGHAHATNATADTVAQKLNLHALTTAGVPWRHIALPGPWDDASRAAVLSAGSGLDWLIAAMRGAPSPDPRA